MAERAQPVRAHFLLVPCPLEASARFFLTMEDNLPRNFYNSIVEEGSIEEEEEVDITAKVRLNASITLILCEFYSIVFCHAMDSRFFNTNAFVYFVL